MISQRLAYVLAPFFLLIDVWRRFGAWHEWPMILDDVIGGVLLVVALIRIHKDRASGARWLAGAWGYCTGMMYSSFFGQLMHMGEPDPSGYAHWLVVLVKGILLAACVAGLAGALAASKPNAHSTV